MIRLTGPLHLLVPVTLAPLVMFALCLFSAAQDQQPTPTPTETPVPKSIVKGRVVYEDSSRPVRRSRILLFQVNDSRRELTSVTDRDGKFEIKDVPAGVYFAMVDSPGIITPLPFMKMTEAVQPQSVDRKSIKEYCDEVVVDGASDLTVTIHARRGGAISGKVTYQDGDPAINAEVNVFRRAGKQATRILTGINVASFLALHTDDRGMYRIAALPPGEYVVSAAESNTTAAQGSVSRGGFDDFFRSDALTATYYGGSYKLEEALTVTIEAGGETRDIDIALPELAVHTIRGLLVAHMDGLPLPQAVITLRNKDHQDWFQQSSRKTQTDSHGQWSLEDVPDGTYRISAEPPYSLPRPAVVANVQNDDEPVQLRKLVPKEVEVTVAGADVAAGSIELSEGASISGTYTLPNGSHEGYLTVSCIYEGDSGPRERPSGGGSGGTFSVESLRAGKFLVSASLHTYSSGGMEDREQFYIKSITLDGKDLTKTPVTIVEGQSIKNIHIVVGSDVAHAKIQLLDSRGKPIAGRPVLVMPANSPGSLFPGDSVLGATDANGIVSVSGAPGEYVVLAPGPEDPWPPTDESKNRRAPSAPRIKLDPGANKVITVTLSP